MFEGIRSFLSGTPDPEPTDAVGDVMAHYRFPFELRTHQVDGVNRLAAHKGAGVYMGVGTGKTAVATALAMYHGLEGNIDRILVIMPPILLLQWQEWFALFPELDVQLYMGSPSARKGMSLEKDVTLMSFDIFKRDNSRIRGEFLGVNTYVIVDEASKIRRVQTLGFKAVRDFLFTGGVRYFCLLSGTPINSPVHCYPYIRLVSPELYKNYNRFSLMHIKSVDFFGEPNGFQRLDLLKKALEHRSYHVDSDVALDLPEVTYDRVDYDLAPNHKALYDRVAEDKLVELDEGVIDGTTQQRLYQALQKLILHPAEFGGEKIKPGGFKLVDTTVVDTGIPDNSGGKLIIYAHYQQSNEAVAQYLKKFKSVKCVQAYGKIGAQKNLKNVQKFLNDPSVNVLVANPRSVGIGLNLQAVCSSMLFLELPITADDFVQAVGRIKREGQVMPCLIRFGVARGTIQQELARRIVRKEDLAQKIVPTKETLRTALFGSGE